jgi:hypothetical protein
LLENLGVCRKPQDFTGLGVAGWVGGFGSREDGDMSEQTAMRKYPWLVDMHERHRVPLHERRKPEIEVMFEPVEHHAHCVPLNMGPIIALLPASMDVAVDRVGGGIFLKARHPFASGRLVDSGPAGDAAEVFSDLARFLFNEAIIHLDPDIEEWPPWLVSFHQAATERIPIPPQSSRIVKLRSVLCG